MRTQHTRTNVRSHRTRRQLREAVLALAERMDLAEITVNQITAEAGLNRTTYYLHYPDRDTLVEETMTILLDEITESGRMLREAEDPRAARFRPDWQDSLFRRISERPALFRRLLGGSGGSGPASFRARLLRANEEAIMVVWSRMGLAEPPGGPPLRVRARFAAAGVLGIILQWLDGGMAESPDTISDWAWVLVFPGTALPAKDNAAPPDVHVPADAPI